MRPLEVPHVAVEFWRFQIHRCASVIHCQHVHVGWGLSHAVEFLVAGGGRSVQPITIFCVVKTARIHEYFPLSPLQNHMLSLHTAQHKKDFGEMESGTTELPHSVLVRIMQLYDWMKE